MENSFKQQIHQILRITSTNGKIDYRGRIYAKNEVVLEPVWISDAFELCEPEIYNLATTVTRDDESKNIFTVSIVLYNEQTSDDESKYEEKHNNALIGPVESIAKK